jgi:S1-C subfamily serine protease
MNLLEHFRPGPPARRPGVRLQPQLHWCYWLGLLGCLTGPGRAADADIRRDAAVAAIEQVMPSVVNIATETVIEYHEFYDELLRRFYGWPRTPARQQKSISLGSGVIIDADGFVLTNFHVVRRASRIQVKLWDGREYEADPYVSTELTDIALLKLKTKKAEKFRAIKLAPDDDLLLGETVLALGNPYGLGASVTKGILSSKNRRSTANNEALGLEDWLQTDAAINPGNSGGPLVNLRGELIGLNVAVYREEDGERGPGVGFSIPVKQISSTLSRFFTPELTDSLWFGAQFKAGAGPLIVGSVQSGSPAARAGLCPGDQVLAIDGQVPQGLIAGSRLLSAAPDHKVSLLVGRGKEHRDVAIQMISFESLIRQKLGLRLRELTTREAKRLGVPAGEALVIDEVEKGSPGERAQLQPGYLTAGIDGKNTGQLRTVAELLSEKKKGESVQMEVIVPRRLGASVVEFRRGAVEIQVR